MSVSGATWQGGSPGWHEATCSAYSDVQRYSSMQCIRRAEPPEAQDPPGSFLVIVLPLWHTVSWAMLAARAEPAAALGAAGVSSPYFCGKRSEGQTSDVRSN